MKTIPIILVVLSSGILLCAFPAFAIAQSDNSGGSRSNDNSGFNSGGSTDNSGNNGGGGSQDNSGSGNSGSSSSDNSGSSSSQTTCPDGYHLQYPDNNCVKDSPLDKAVTHAFCGAIGPVSAVVPKCN